MEPICCWAWACGDCPDAAGLGRGYLDDAVSDAAAGNHVDLVSYLIDRGGDVNLALEEAVNMKATETVQLMVQRGATCHAVDQCDNCMETAVRPGSVHILELLLTAGGTLRSCSASNGPLTVAAETEGVKMVEFLLKRGVTPADDER